MSPVGKRVLPSTFNHRPPITTTKALCAAQFVKKCGDDVRHGPPARRRGSPRPRLLQPPCWTSPQCCFATIVGVSARCASRLCDVAVADSGSQCNWPRGVGTRERRQRWWVQWLETLSVRGLILCGALVPCCVDRIWLLWCFRARCAWHLLRLAHSIPSGAG